ncbi:MAG TPA: N-acetylmuramoyl-L-alanine amidase [Terriglobales bacterium]|nr:N-acetylmuramoyl-L-alanine amidase [Terriglobales bacterium]
MKLRGLFPFVSANPKNPTLDLLKTPAELAPSGAPVVPSHEALQALLAFSSLHEQILQRREREKHHGVVSTEDVWELEQFVLDEVLQLVSDRALAITGADGVAIALADGDAIICRASSGKIAPDAGVRLDPKAGFSGACLTSGHIIRCDDSEHDERVNVQTCRTLGARSMVAVPLSARQSVIGLLEAFSSEAFGFNDSDVRSLNLLAELILAALKPEEEDRLAEISQRVVARVADPINPLPVVDSTHISEFAEIPQVDPEEDPEVLAGIPEVGMLEVGIPEISPAEIATVPVPNDPVEIERVESGRLIDHALAENEVPEMFAESLPAEKSWLVRIVLPLALAVLVVAGGWWWKLSHHSTEPSHPLTSLPATTTTSGATSPQDLDYTPATPATEKSGAAEKGSAVTGIRHWSASDSSTVVIDLQDQVQYEAHRLSNPERIYFDLHDTTLPPDLANKSIAVLDALLVQVRMAQPAAGITRVVLETKVAADYSVSLEQNPYRLVVEVRKLGAKPQPRARVDLFGPANPSETIEAKGPQSTGASVLVKSALAPSSIATNHAQANSHVPQIRLVLDAGHGGWDLGTVGRKGLMEKDLVLDIVDRLGKLVQSKLGAEVIYTRQDDTYIPLEKRAEIANVAHADLFLSIHANYSDFPSARGVETYYTNTYSSLKARTPGADTTDPALQNVNWTNVDIREKVQESHRFAASIQRSLYGNLSTKNPGLRDRGVKAASYVVLTGTEMPAILAEVSFVSSPTDESELQRSAYRQQIAEALYQGISRYAEASQKVKLASAKK